MYAASAPLEANVISSILRLDAASTKSTILTKVPFNACGVQSVKIRKLKEEELVYLLTLEDTGQIGAVVDNSNNLTEPFPAFQFVLVRAKVCVEPSQD